MTIKRTLAAMGLVAALVPLGTAALAAPKVSEKTKTYSISATTIGGLTREMDQKGPQGYWAYTAWNVRWSGSCKLTVDVVYTLPKHANPSAMPALVRRKFDTMLAALTQHEHQHGQHGILAAQEIEKAGCTGSDAIIKKYNAADIAFDRKTNHGIRQGATLY